MKKIFKPLAIIAGAAVVVGIGIALATGQLTSCMSNAGESAKATAANAAIEGGGFKQRINEALDNKRDEIANATGATPAEVSAGIESLAIEDWQITTLPSDAVSAEAFDVNYAGMSGTITTYTDPHYVTLNGAGQSITFEIPPDAQDYLPYLSYLN